MTQKRPLSRSQKRFLSLGVLLVALILGAHQVFFDANPQIKIPPPVPTPRPNALDFYLQAAQTIQPTNPPIDELEEPIRVTDPKIRAQRYSLARRQAWLRSNAAGFALVQKALETPCVFPSERVLKNGRSNVRNTLQKVARFKEIEAQTARESGDWNAATQSGLDLVQMGLDLRRGNGNPGIGFIIHSGFKALFDAPDTLGANPSRRAARRLEKLLKTRPTLTGALQEEKWVVLERYQTALKTPDWRHSSNYLFAGMRPTPIDLWRAQTTSKSRILANVTALWDAKIANSRLPFGAPENLAVKSNNLFTQFETSSVAHHRFSQAREIAALRLLMLRFALRAFRLEQGRFPANLKELTPSFLSTVPLDPFNQKPLRFKISGQNYLLWSVGPDQKDDGGTPAQPKTPPILSPGAPLAPPVLQDSVGDFVAGKNR